MVRQVKVSNFAEVQGIVSAAAKCYNEVGVHDMKGSIADAKSILGMMSLDYSHPVKIVCEDEHDLDCGDPGTAPVNSAARRAGFQPRRQE